MSVIPRAVEIHQPYISIPAATFLQARYNGSLMKPAECTTQTASQRIPQTSFQPLLPILDRTEHHTVPFSMALIPNLASAFKNPCISHWHLPYTIFTTDTSNYRNPKMSPRCQMTFSPRADRPPQSQSRCQMCRSSPVRRPGMSFIAWAYAAVAVLGGKMVDGRYHRSTCAKIITPQLHHSLPLHPMPNQYFMFPLLETNIGINRP